MIFPQWIIYHPTPQRVFPYHPQWAMKETEDFPPMDHVPFYSSASFFLSSLMSHEGNIRFFPNGSCIILLFDEFSLPSPVSHEGNRRFFPNGLYTILLISKFFLIIPLLVHISSRNWICRYCRKGRGRNRDRGRDQGHPEVRASPE